MNKQKLLSQMQALDNDVEKIRMHQRQILLSLLRACAAEYGVTFKKLVLQIEKQRCQWDDRCIECCVNSMQCDPPFDPVFTGPELLSNEIGPKLYDDLHWILSDHRVLFEKGFTDGEIITIEPDDIDI